MEQFNNQSTHVKHTAKLSKGFTLLEIMVTVAIAGILSAIALPSFNDFLVRMRVDNEVIEIQRLLLTARNTAINTGLSITVCPLTVTNTCQIPPNWAGRIGVIQLSAIIPINPINDVLIKEKSAIKLGDQLQFAFPSVTYNLTGQLLNNTVGTFSYCPQNKSIYSRGVTVALSGRSSLSNDNNRDGHDQDRAGVNITCP